MKDVAPERVLILREVFVHGVETIIDNHGSLFLHQAELRK